LYKEHINCGMALEDDVVVHLQKVQVIVDAVTICRYVGKVGNYIL
jgi:hypothetical protein